MLDRRQGKPHESASRSPVPRNAPGMDVVEEEKEEEEEESMEPGE